MQKIATPQDLQAELRQLLAYCQTPNPSREKLAGELRGLADRVAGLSKSQIDRLYNDIDQFLYEGHETRGGRGDLRRDEHILMDWYQYPERFSDDDVLTVVRTLQQAKKRRGLR